MLGTSGLLLPMRNLLVKFACLIFALATLNTCQAKTTRHTQSARKTPPFNPIRCGKDGSYQCRLISFDRARNCLSKDTHPYTPAARDPCVSNALDTKNGDTGADKERDWNYVSVIRGAGAKVIYSGTIIIADFDNDQNSKTKPRDAQAGSVALVKLR